MMSFVGVELCLCANLNVCELSLCLFGLLEFVFMIQLDALLLALSVLSC